MAKNVKAEAPQLPPKFIEEMRRLWRGGERRKAAELARSVNPTARQRNDWAAEFPGIFEIEEA